jgi:hypothetical protein
MVYTKVKSPVEVLMSFRASNPEPVAFRWRDECFHIKKINLIHAERIGAKKIYFFSVSSGINTFRLGFCTESLTWWLEEMC